MKTAEQEKYVAEIIGKRKVPSKTYRDRRIKHTDVPAETKKTDYMRNCIFWIDEFIEGRTDADRLNSAINALQVHLNDLRKEYPHH